MLSLWTDSQRGPLAMSSTHHRTLPTKKGAGSWAALASWSRAGFWPSSGPTLLVEVVCVCVRFAHRLSCYRLLALAGEDCQVIEISVRPRRRSGTLGPSPVAEDPEIRHLRAPRAISPFCSIPVESSLRGFSPHIFRL